MRMLKRIAVFIVSSLFSISITNAAVGGNYYVTATDVSNLILNYDGYKAGGGINATVKGYDTKNDDGKYAWNGDDVSPAYCISPNGITPKGVEYVEITPENSEKYINAFCQASDDSGNVDESILIPALKTISVQSGGAASAVESTSYSESFRYWMKEIYKNVGTSEESTKVDLSEEKLKKFYKAAGVATSSGSFSTKSTKISPTKQKITITYVGNLETTDTSKIVITNKEKIKSIGTIKIDNTNKTITFTIEKDTSVSCNTGDHWGIEFELTTNLDGTSQDDSASSDDYSSCSCNLRMFNPINTSSGYQYVVSCDNISKTGTGGGSGATDELGSDENPYSDQVYIYCDDTETDTCDNVTCDYGTNLSQAGNESHICDKDGIRLISYDELTIDDDLEKDSKIIECCVFDRKTHPEIADIATEAVLQNNYNDDYENFCQIYCIESYNSHLPKPDSGTYGKADNDVIINSGTFFTIDGDAYDENTVTCYGHVDLQALVNYIDTQSEKLADLYSEYVTADIVLNTTPTCSVTNNNFIKDQKCSKGYNANNNKDKCCPYSNSNIDGNQCCQSNTYLSSGICCPSGYENVGGTCCEYGSILVNGTCCKSGSVNVDGVCRKEKGTTSKTIYNASCDTRTISYTNEISCTNTDNGCTIRVCENGIKEGSKCYNNFSAETSRSTSYSPQQYSGNAKTEVQSTAMPNYTSKNGATFVYSTTELTLGDFSSVPKTPTIKGTSESYDNTFIGEIINGTTKRDVLDQADASAISKCNNGVIKAKSDTTFTQAEKNFEDARDGDDGVNKLIENAIKYYEDQCNGWNISNLESIIKKNATIEAGTFEFDEYPTVKQTNFVKTSDTNLTKLNDTGKNLKIMTLTTNPDFTSAHQIKLQENFSNPIINSSSITFKGIYSIESKFCLSPQGEILGNITENSEPSGEECIVDSESGVVVEGIPVDYETSQGIYYYYYTFDGLGHYFSSYQSPTTELKTGRMSEKSMLTNNIKGLNVCTYNVNNCNKCKTQCTSTTVKDSCADEDECDYGCQTTCRGGGCIFEENYGVMAIYKTISLNQLFALSNKYLSDEPQNILAMNMERSSSKTFKKSNWDKTENAKAQETISNIERDSEHIYENDPEYKIVLTSDNIEKIKKWNELHTGYSFDEEENNYSLEFKYFTYKSPFIHGGTDSPSFEIANGLGFSNHYKWNETIEEFVGPAWK